MFIPVLPDGDYLELPFLPLPPDFEKAIVFLCSNQTSFEVMAEMVRYLEPEVVVGIAKKNDGWVPVEGTLPP